MLTSWVTRPLIWMGGGVGTEELFTCQARGLALNMRLASLRLAEEGGRLLTWLVPLRSQPHPRGELSVRREREPKRPGSSLCHFLPFFAAPSSPVNPDLGRRPWAMAWQVAAQAGRTGWKWSLASPLCAEGREDAVLQALNFRARRLHALWV